MAKKSRVRKTEEGMKAYTLARNLVAQVEKAVENEYTIGDVETAMAAMLVTIVRSIDDMYPEMHTETLDRTLDRFLLVSDGCNNSIYRTLIMAYGLCAEGSEEDKCPKL